MNDNPVSGERINPLLDRAVEACMEVNDKIWAALVGSGSIALHVQVDDERQRWMRLTALRAANSPEYYDDPEAPAELARLAERFGAPGSTGAPPFPLPPFGGQFGG